MNIKTYTSRDMRTALGLVRDEQGPDAVILATRHLADGVEVTVAVGEGAIAPDEVPVSRQREAAPETAPEGGLAQAFAAVAGAQSVAADARMGEELRSMRHLLEWQVSQLAWNDLTRRTPETAELMKELTAMGVAGSLVTELLKELPQGLGVADAQRTVLAQLARRIGETGDELLDNGGRIAFVGPTGVGKTTGIAKLAARWVMRHGARDIALVSMDDQRFGAHEQLRVLGRLLGVESYTLDDPQELPDLLARLPRHRLVLIDTAGISPRDRDLEARAAAIGQAVRQCGIDVWLTLSAGAQAGVLEDSLQAFRGIEPRAVLLTKVDEASSLGGALSALATSGLPLAYVSSGPRIPEDLAPARAHQLVARALFLARTSDTTAGEELLVRRFGGVAHALR